MPLAIRPGELVRLVRETRSLEQRARPLVLLGAEAPRLADALRGPGGGDGIRLGGPLEGAAALVVVLEGDPVEAEQAAMRRATRLSVPVMALTRGARPTLPYVLDGDVIEAGAGELPLERLATSLAAALSADDAVALAASLPPLREAVARRLTQRTSLENAARSMSSGNDRPAFPLLTLAQSRMLLRIGVLSGGAAPTDPQRLVASAAPPLLASLLAGAVFRRVYRSLPVQGPLVGAAVAYAGTRALGELRRRLPPG